MRKVDSHLRGLDLGGILDCLLDLLPGLFIVFCHVLVRNLQGYVSNY